MATRCLCRAIPSAPPLKKPIPPPRLLQTRSFHATRPTPFIAEALDLSTSFIQTVHTTTHLPWALSIPLSALIVRTAIAFPLTLYAKHQARRERDLVPLLSAWSKLHDKILTHPRNPDRPETDIQKQKQTLLLATKTKSDIKRRYRIPALWAPLPALQLPVWIAVMESLRAMCGSDNGLVPWLLSLFDDRDATGSMPPVEPSLATEGMLWFPDLLAGDPTGMLPLMLTGSILLNLRLGWKTPDRKAIAKMPREQMLQQGSWLMLRNFVKVLAVYVGVSGWFYEMPAALMVYWITSTNFATVQNVLLDRHLFKMGPVKLWRKVPVKFVSSRWLGGL